MNKTKNGQQLFTDPKMLSRHAHTFNLFWSPITYGEKYCANTYKVNRKQYKVLTVEKSLETPARPSAAQTTVPYGELLDPGRALLPPHSELR